MWKQPLVTDFFKKYRWQYIMAVVAVGISKIVQVQIPNIIGNLINQFRLGITVRLIQHYAGELAVVSIGYVLLFGLGQFTVGKLARIFEAHLRQRLFSHWELLESQYFQKHTVGDLLSHVLNDVPAVRQAMAGGISQILQAIFLFLATLAMTVTKINWILTAASLIPLLLIPVVVVRIGPKIRRQSRLVQESLSEMSDLAEESLQSIRLIKSTANEPIETKRFTRKTDVIYDRSMDLVRLNTTFQALIPLLTGISFAIALVFGGELTLTHKISLGAFVAFTVYLSMLVRPLMQFGNVINIFQNSSASLLRIDTLLKAKPEITDPASPQSMPTFPSLTIQDLTFKYPHSAKPALQHITLKIPAGSTLGIVGHTGAGKTTLCSLLLHELDPDPGTIFIGGVDIRDLSRADLREHVAYVPQDGFLFSFPVGDNIGFPLADSNSALVTEAAHKARILTTIQNMPRGFATIVGERGINLSGGQRQRVAIARALVKMDAKILILDDSLSAVDSRTESSILTALQELRQKNQTTTIIISHKLSSLRNADNVLVLKDGMIAEYGSPKDLLSRHDGIYSHLYHIQTQGGAHLG